MIKNISLIVLVSIFGAQGFSTILKIDNTYGNSSMDMGKQIQQTEIDAVDLLNQKPKDGGFDINSVNMQNLSSEIILKYSLPSMSVLDYKQLLFFYGRSFKELVLTFHSAAHLPREAQLKYYNEMEFHNREVQEKFKSFIDTKGEDLTEEEFQKFKSENQLLYYRRSFEKYQKVSEKEMSAEESRLFEANLNEIFDFLKERSLQVLDHSNKYVSSDLKSLGLNDLNSGLMEFDPVTQSIKFLGQREMASDPYIQYALNELAALRQAMIEVIEISILDWNKLPRYQKEQVDEMWELAELEAFSIDQFPEEVQSQYRRNQVQWLHKLMKDAKADPKRLDPKTAIQRVMREKDSEYARTNPNPQKPNLKEPSELTPETPRKSFDITPIESTQHPGDVPVFDAREDDSE